jgi:hypothetical protein
MKEKEVETRRKFIKASVAAATGLAALPLLSQKKMRRVKPSLKVAQLDYMKGSKALKKSKDLTIADLNQLMRIAIGSLEGADRRFSAAYKRSRATTTFKGLNQTDLADIAEHGLSALSSDLSLASCGSCASCCCCCCPCCCCS